jgi:phosphoserine phosphatase RsbU/P
MNRPSENPVALKALRDKIIGLGERSLRKSYYPKLQQKLKELEQLSRRYELFPNKPG